MYLPLLTRSTHLSPALAAVTALAFGLAACDGQEPDKPKPAQGEAAGEPGSAATAAVPPVKLVTLAELVTKISAAADQAKAAEAAELTKLI